MASSLPQLEAAARKFLESRGYRIQHPLEQAPRESSREALSRDMDGFRNVFQWAVGKSTSEKPCLLLALVPIFVHLFFELIEARELKLGDKFLSDHRLLAGIDAACQRVWDGLASLKKPSQLEDDPLYDLFSKGHLLNLFIPEAVYDVLYSRLVSTRMALADIFNRRVRFVSTSDVSKARLVPETSCDEENLLNGSLLHLKVDTDNPPVAYGACWKMSAGSDSRDSFSAGNVEQKFGYPLPDSSSKQRQAASMHFAKLAADKHELDMKRLPDVRLFVAEFSECSDDINCMAISNDGRHCAAGLRCARLWEVDSKEDTEHDAKRRRSNPVGAQLCAHQDLDGDQGRVLDASFSCDSELLLTAGQDSTVQLWHVQKKQRLGVFSSQSSHQPIWAVDWCPLGHYFASSAAKGVGYLWCLERSSPLRSFVRDGVHASAEIEIIKAHPSGRYMSVVYSDQILLWDIMVARPARILPVNDMVTALGFSADGTRILTGTHEGSLQPWDLLSGKIMRAGFSAHRGPITSLGFSWPCGSSSDMAFTCGHDGFVRFWSQGHMSSSDDVGTEHEASLPLHSLSHSKQLPSVIDGAFTPSNDLLLACV